MYFNNLEQFVWVKWRPQWQSKTHIVIKYLDKSQPYVYTIHAYHSREKCLLWVGSLTFPKASLRGLWVLLDSIRLEITQKVYDTGFEETLWIQILHNAHIRPQRSQSMRQSLWNRHSFRHMVKVFHLTIATAEGLGTTAGVERTSSKVGHWRGPERLLDVELAMFAISYCMLVYFYFGRETGLHDAHKHKTLAESELYFW